MRKKITPYIISIAVALITGGLSAFLTKGNMDIYKTINQPPLAPPVVLFPVVWSLLFILMGIGSAIIYTKEKNSARKEALTVYIFQLAVNFFWSIIFFNLRIYFFAFIWLLLLWLLIIDMIVKFKKISSISAYLQIPYLLWVTFAGYLNFMIFLLN